MCTLREIRMKVIRMIMRVTCHHEVCGTCSQEEGSLQCPPFNLPILLEQKMGGLKIIGLFETEVYFLCSLGHVASGSEERGEHL